MVINMEKVNFRIPKEMQDQFIERVFKRVGYCPHGRADKGVLLRYIERMTGLSRQQVARPVAQYRKEWQLIKHQQRIAPANGLTSHSRSLM